MTLTHIAKMPITGELTPGPHATGVYITTSPDGSELVIKTHATIPTGAGKEYAAATSAKKNPALAIPALVTPAGAGVAAEGQLWVAYPRHAGAPLPEVAATLTPAEGADLLIALAEAVSVLHGNGVFHHNIGPHQVYVDGAGAPALLDVGWLWEESGVRPNTAAADIAGLASVAAALPLTAAVKEAAQNTAKPSVASYLDALLKAKARDAVFTPERAVAPAGGLPTGAAGGLAAPAPASAPVEPPAPAPVPAPVEPEPTPAAPEPAPVEPASQEALTPVEPEPVEPELEQSAAPVEVEPVEAPTAPVEQEEPAPAEPAAPAPVEPEPVPAEPVSDVQVPVEPVAPTPAPTVVFDQDTGRNTSRPVTPASSAPGSTSAPEAPAPPPTPVVAPVEAQAPVEPLAPVEPVHVEPPAPEPVETPAPAPAEPAVQEHPAEPTETNLPPAPTETKERPRLSRRTLLIGGGALGATLLLGGGAYLATRTLAPGEATSDGLTDKLTTAPGETKTSFDGYGDTALYSIPISEQAKVFATAAAIAVQNNTTLDLYDTGTGELIRTVEMPEGISIIRETRIGEDPALVWRTGGKFQVYTRPMGKDKDLITLEKPASVTLIDSGQRPMLLDGAKVSEITATGEKNYETVAGSTPISIDAEGMISGSYEGPVIISAPDGKPIRTVDLTAPADNLHMVAWVYAGHGLTCTIWAEDPQATDATTPTHLVLHSLSDGAVTADVPMPLGVAQSGKWNTGQGAVEAAYGQLVFSVARAELVTELPEGWAPVRIKGSHVIAEDSSGARQIFSGSNPGFVYSGNLLAQVEVGLVVQKGNAIMCYPSALS